MKNSKKIFGVILLFYLCSYTVQGQNNKIKDDKVIIVGIKTFDQLVLVQPNKKFRRYKDEAISVFTEKENINLLTKKGASFRHHIFDTNCHCLCPYGFIIHDCVLPIASPEVNAILKQTYPYSVSSVNDLFVNSKYQYKSLLYSECKYNRYLVILMNLATYNRYNSLIDYNGPRQEKYRFEKDITKKRRYIKVLIPLKTD